MTDEELIARMRDVKLTWGDSLEAAARIEHLAVICEELEAELLETQDSADALATVEKHIEAMTEQLEAARADAKQAEAYAEELAQEIEINEQEACSMEDDLMKAYKEIEALEAKLAKAVEALRLIEAGCEADYPPSHLAIKYAARTTLAEIEGDTT